MKERRSRTEEVVTEMMWITTYDLCVSHLNHPLLNRPVQAGASGPVFRL